MGERRGYAVHHRNSRDELTMLGSKPGGGNMNQEYSGKASYPQKQEIPFRGPRRIQRTIFLFNQWILQ